MESINSIGNPGNSPIEDQDEVFVQNAAKEALTEAAEEATQREAGASASLAEDAESNYNPTVKSNKLTPAPNPNAVKDRAQVEESVFVRKDAEDLANEFSKKRENQAWALPTNALVDLVLALGKDINSKSNITDIIKFIEQSLIVQGEKADPGQVDKAFEFLIGIANARLIQLRNAEPDSPRIQPLSELVQKLTEAREEYFKSNQVAINSDKRLTGVVEVVSDLGVLDGAEARKHIKEMASTSVNNPKDLSTRFAEYERRGFKYNDIHKEAMAILHYVGDEVKTFEKFDNGQMFNLMHEARVNQALLIVFRFFKNQEPAIESFYERNNYHRE